MSGLREALEKLAGDLKARHDSGSYSYPEANAYVDGKNNGYEAAADEIREQLAAHPEPAAGVTEQAVRVVAEYLAEAHSGRLWDQYTAETRELLIENYLPTARVALQSAAPFLGVRPVVDREAVIQAIEAASEPEGSDNIMGRKYVENWADVFADAVLALLNGEGSETTRAVVQSENK